MSKLCNLCNNAFEKDIKNHIISKFFIENLGFYNTKHFTNKIEINTDTIKIERQNKTIPDFAYEYGLFCEKCERKMRDYEDYCSMILFGGKNKSSIEYKIYKGRYCLTNIDYTKMKLGLLVNLFRMAFSNREEFQLVKLSHKHKEELKDMLHNCKSKEWFYYPTLVMLNNWAGNIFLPPVMNNDIVEITFGNLSIYYLIDLNSNAQFHLLKELTLNENNNFSVINLTNHQFIFDALCIDYKPKLNFQL